MASAHTMPDRIRRPGEYKRVYGSGSKIAGRYLVMFYGPASMGHTRVGITVSRKVGGAVVRNREKRRLREALRLEVGNATSVYDIVFVALGRIKAASFMELCADMRKLLSRVRP